jgi:hypothetical protein
MIDRTKFKATPLAVTQSQEDEQQALQPYGGGGTDFLKLEEGDNYLRIYPAHPDGESFTMFKSQVFLPVMVTYKNDQGVEVTELKRMPVMNAIYHSDIMEKDVVNEYMAFAKEFVKPNVNPQEWGRIWGLITGREDSLKSSDAWVVYGGLDNLKVSGEFGKIDVKKSIKNSMNKIAAEMAKDRGIDPFTDPDTGIRLIINKNKARGEAGGDWYETTLESQMVDSFTKTFIPTPLSDEQLEIFVKQEPLEKMYKNVYSQEDFVQAMEGLERWDTQNKIGIWNYQEFRVILNELADVADKLPIRTEQKEVPAQSAAPIAVAPIAAAPIAAPIVQPAPTVVPQGSVVTTPTPVPTQVVAPVAQVAPQAAEVAAPVVKTGIEGVTDVKAVEMPDDMPWEDETPKEQAEQIPPTTEVPPTQAAPIVAAAEGTPMDRLAAMKNKLEKGG